MSQVVSAAQFVEPSFKRLRKVLFPQDVRVAWGSKQATIEIPHRKVWEFCYMATTNKIAGTTAGFALRPIAIR